MRTKTRGLLRPPGRVERYGNAFNPSVLNVRRAQGRRVLPSATATDGLSAPTRDKPEDAECNAPPIEVVIPRHLLRYPLKPLDADFA